MRTFIELWRKRLFSSRLNTFISLLLLALLVWLLPQFLEWALFDATFAGDSREACTSSGHHGACWVFVRVRFWQFMYGLYPVEERWRAHTVFSLLTVLVLPLFLPFTKRIRRVILTLLLLAFPVVSFILLHGGLFGLQVVETSLWGGFMLTLIISSIGIVGSLPGGILLALGRRSRLPFIRAVSVAFIELWRGVPLITVLFMASVMFPLFLPREVHVDKLLRALVGTTLFASAYMAEVVRGGLQAISSGQSEAASALGLSYFQSVRLIILPQALRIVIPGIVNTFIGLVKDTSLVLIIGMFDLLGMVQAAATDPNWLGLSIEGYLFAGTCFWLICHSLSSYSRRMELRLKKAAST